MGISQAYDTGTKIASIYKESATNTVGWDSIWPVQSSETTFTTIQDIELNPYSLFHPDLVIQHIIIQCKRL